MQIVFVVIAPAIKRKSEEAKKREGEGGRGIENRLKTGHKQLLHGATVSTIYLASWTWFNEHLCKSRREPHPVVAILSGRRHSVMHSGTDSRWCKPLVNHSELSGCLSMCACVVCIALRGVSEAGQTLSIPCVGSPSNYTRRTLAHTHTHSHTLTLWHFELQSGVKRCSAWKQFSLCVAISAFNFWGWTNGWHPIGLGLVASTKVWGIGMPNLLRLINFATMRQ